MRQSDRDAIRISADFNRDEAADLAAEVERLKQEKEALVAACEEFIGNCQMYNGHWEATVANIDALRRAVRAALTTGEKER